MVTDIQLHQTLHGYGDGHQLLASSLELTREQQWQMLVMSDLSGPSFRPGFDTYLTGYPLEAGGFYCFARTWFASELPRPGCVWTHTILVSDTDVARIADFSSLSSFFRRPQANLDFDSYAMALRSEFTQAGLGNRSFDQDVSAALIYALYGSPGRRVVLNSKSAPQHEQVVVAIFSQQWPRLRRSFRFCTGALAIRDVYFDLAVAPHDVIRQESEETMTISSEDVRALNEHLSEDWVRTAVADLPHAEVRTALRQFLWTFGPDYSDGRVVFQPLCEIHLASLASSRSPESVNEVLSAMAHFFPQPDSSRRLKAAVFGADGSLGEAQSGESLVLQALVTHPSADCIPLDVAAIDERARALVDSDHESAIRIAVVAANVGGARAERYLDGLVSGLRSRPDYFRAVPWSLTPDLLRRDPELLTAPELWKTSADQQSVLAAQLASLRDIEKHGRRITGAVLAASAWSVLPSVLARFGHDAVSAVLEWVDALPDGLLALPEEVFAGLSEQRYVLVEVIAQRQCGPGALRVASALLDPRSSNVRDLGTRVWAHAIERDVRFVDSGMELRSRAFLLSLGLSMSGEEAVHLVRECFSAVYEGAKHSQLNDHLWRFVEPYLPWYRVSWDRCARLIRGVVRLFLDRHWPASEFLATFRTGEQFRRALGEADRTYRGGRYIRQICELVASGSVKLDDDHSEALTDFCDSTHADSIPEL